MTLKKFKKFYRAESHNLRKNYYFFKSDNMKSKASYGIIEEGYIIVTPHSVIPKNYSIHIAHEIEHLIFCSEGYKQVSFIDDAKSNYSRRNRMLNDMIYDPLVNRKLIKFNFDLETYLDNAYEIHTKTMTDTKHPENIFLATTLYVKYFFDYKNIFPDIKQTDIKFIQWVSKNYFDVVSTAEEIIKIIEMNDRGNPKGIESIYKLIFQTLNIDDEFTLINM